jgi:hypothetical protein
MQTICPQVCPHLQALVAEVSCRALTMKRMAGWQLWADWEKPIKVCVGPRMPVVNEPLALSMSHICASPGTHRLARRRHFLHFYFARHWNSLAPSMPGESPRPGQSP